MAAKARREAKVRRLICALLLVRVQDQRRSDEGEVRVRGRAPAPDAKDLGSRFDSLRDFGARTNQDTIKLQNGRARAQSEPKVLSIQETSTDGPFDSKSSKVRQGSALGARSFEPHDLDKVNTVRVHHYH